MLETLDEILAFREEIKTDIVDLLEETGSDFSLQDVLEVIYEEEESEYLQKVIMMFDDGDPMNLSNVVELATDAWNYFPHRMLGGLSPAEKLLK